MSGLGEVVIELGEGFSDDDVAVLVDGQEVWRTSGITTNWSVGLADVVRIAADASRLSEVEVRARGATVSHQVERSAKLTDHDELRLRAAFSPDGDLRLAPADGGTIF